MDRAPQPGIPEEQPDGLEIVRKKRLLERLRGFVRREEPQELNLDSTEPEDASGELWSREEEAEVEVGERPVQRLQLFGREVLEQTNRVHNFAEDLSETVAELPPESREVVEPQANRLQKAAVNLKAAAQELNDGLSSLGQTAPELEPEDSAEITEPADDAEETQRVVPEAEPVKPEAAEKPKKDRSEALGMARLVIATLIGGGLGALVGEGRKQAKTAAKEKASMAAKIEEQKVKIDAQEAELQKLKEASPESAGQKEYVKKAAELTERQTELTHTTVEQVREAAKQTAESDRTFKLPEQQPANTERVYPEGAERLRERAGEAIDRQGEQVEEQVAVAGMAQATQTNDTQDSQSSPHPQYDQPIKQAPQTWIFWALLAVAAVAVGLIVFGSR